MSVLSRPRWNQRNIHRLEFEARLVHVGRERGFGCLQPVLVIALGEIGLVMRAPRFIAHARTLRNYSRQLQHVVKLAREHDGRIGPLRPVAQVDVLEALGSSAKAMA